MSAELEAVGLLPQASCVSKKRLHYLGFTRCPAALLGRDLLGVALTEVATTVLGPSGGDPAWGLPNTRH